MLDLTSVHETINNVGDVQNCAPACICGCILWLDNSMYGVSNGDMYANLAYYGSC
jgi:hypothetical protein